MNRTDPPMTHPARRTTAVLAAIILLTGGCAREPRSAPAVPVLRAGAETPAERDAARLTAGWSDAAWQACGPALRSTLAARDRVRGQVDVVKDEDDRVVTLQADAREWIGGADAQLAALRPRIEAGGCDGELNEALAQVARAYTRAALAAEQAQRLAGFGESQGRGR